MDRYSTSPFYSLESARGRSVAQKIVHLRSVSSTMDAAFAYSRELSFEGLAVVADEQISGRGRYKRPWKSQPSKDLLVSFCVSPRISYAYELTIAAAVSVHATVRSVAGITSDLKWPNDVMCDGKKLAGILAESRTDAKGIKSVLGVGLNLNSFYTKDDPINAVSMSMLADRPFSRVDVLDVLLWELDARLKMLRRGETLIPEWKRLLITIGERVHVRFSDSSVPDLKGVAEDVDEKGRLLVRDRHGMLNAVGSGEVSLSPSGGGT